MRITVQSIVRWLVVGFAACGYLWVLLSPGFISVAIMTATFALSMYKINNKKRNHKKHNARTEFKKIA